jgi:hypothetical protein
MIAHFLASLLLVTLLSLMVLSASQSTRMIYLVCVLVLYYATFIVYSYEYDRTMMVKWKSKEDRLQEKLAQKIIELKK